MRMPSGKAGTTIEVTSTNSSKNLVVDDSLVMRLGSAGREQPIKAIVITCESQTIRFAFTADAVQGGLGHLIQVGTTIEHALIIEGIESIKKFEYISNANNTHGQLEISPIYER